MDVSTICCGRLQHESALMKSEAFGQNLRCMERWIDDLIF